MSEEIDNIVEQNANERTEQPCDEYPGSFFRVPSAPHREDSWHLN